MKFLIVNGPNINMLGIREPAIYGAMTYDGLLQMLRGAAQTLGVEAEFFQSNSEGEIVSAIQRAYGRMDAIVINPAAYTHTSVAILDALKAVALPAAEVHISDVTKREAFRQVSYAGMACEFHYIGEGPDGYVHAMETLRRKLDGTLRVLHCMPRKAWEKALDAGEITPAGACLHCAPPEFFHRLDFARFAGEEHVIVSIDPARVPAPTVWETGPENPGRFYPHIRGPVPAAAVDAVLELRCEGGRWLKNPEFAAYADR